MARVPSSSTVRHVIPPDTTRYPYVGENLQRIIVANSTRVPSVPESVRWPYPEGCIIWLGEWELSEDGYQKYDAVYRNGSSYVSNESENTDEPPSSKWDLLALRGATGTAGGLTYATFAFGDATPALIHTTSDSGIVARVELYITTAFNGVGASISIGTSDNHDLFMAANENDPSVLNSFYSHPGYNFNAATDINLYITPGAGASAGSGFAILNLVEE